MSFFEFFFSGPNWGWRFLGLVWMISIVGEIIVKLLKITLDYNLDKFNTQIAKAMHELQYPTDEDNTEDDNNTPATIDDFR